MYAVPGPKLRSERAGKRTPAGMPVHVAATAGILVERWVFFAKATPHRQALLPPEFPCCISVPLLLFGGRSGRTDQCPASEVRKRACHRNRDTECPASEVRDT
jgi:hypothetical protein